MAKNHNEARVDLIIEVGKKLTVRQAEILQRIEGENMTLAQAAMDLNLTISECNREYTGAAISLYRALIDHVLEQGIKKPVKKAS